MPPQGFAGSNIDGVKKGPLCVEKPFLVNEAQEAPCEAAEVDSDNLDPECKADIQRFRRVAAVRGCAAWSKKDL